MGLVLKVGNCTTVDCPVCPTKAPHPCVTEELGQAPPRFYVHDERLKLAGRPRNSMLEEIDAGRLLASALRNYIRIADLGYGPNVADPGDERAVKLAALDVITALNRMEVYAPTRSNTGGNKE